MNIIWNVCAAFCALAPQQYPDHQGVVNDFAHEIDAGIKAKMEAAIHALKEKADVRLVVVTLVSLEGRSIEDYASGLAAKWGVGQKGKNNGILFVHAPNEHKARIENGYGVESRLTDVESKQILHEVVAPLTKGGRTAEGLLKGTEAIAELLMRPEKAPDPVPAAKKEGGSHIWLIVTVGCILLAILGMVVLAPKKEERKRVEDTPWPPPQPVQPSSSSSAIPPFLAGAALGAMAAPVSRPSVPRTPYIPPPPPPPKRRDEGEDDDDDDKPSSFGGLGGGGGGSSSSPDDDDSFAGGGSGGGGATEDV